MHSRSSVAKLLAFAALPLLAACGGEDAPAGGQRISLEQARRTPAEPLASPDSEGATWQVSADGQAIDFGKSGQKPYLTLACRMRENLPQVRIIRHVPARPGEKALFPVLGTGNARFNLDAALEDGEWRWQGDFPANDKQLEVFSTTGRIQATLPGGGMLMIDGSRVPGEFVSWCRAGRGLARAAEAEQAQAAEQRAAQRP
jgi:hypothetical protein